ncbi:hypothetical protein EN904_10695 [Mesorhizobium sp. M7A.F.Ca.CA.001.07.2.1]|uniref:hypothetical protein n=1 Tax=Mesorhizobium TaxID=68287 RepID=UPI000FCC3920|nr:MULTISPECIES: hypothetical protein [Mesorhizobium]RVB19232.1 hypothetical protein EN918_32615 [Mesorhizobium sp. M7A.F.Ca.CA.004.05.1.1]MCF6123946.1 hypothetical protein [Mesorhizobium ciceri]MCQ8814944.1 hypothetical protein [Mesorhizobium sp. SEMIA396]RUX68488.1 hypothetical protein EN983_29900 [Mesorhizobium sp. M7A.F.Ca.CA.004.08.2.1]RUX82040.1 hypothetical protein EN982_31145 [Mesorhizobium sp. M7A.F.Ca.CA.004.08.1.1]
MSWTFADVKGHVLGVILIVALFAAVLVLDPLKWTNMASPIRSVVTVDAMVRSVQWDRVGIYLVSVENGPSVLIKDKRLHLIGSRISIERVTRDNGTIFYRFPE